MKKASSELLEIFNDVAAKAATHAESGFDSPFAAFVGMLAVVAATINVVGGYLVTDRMLQKFKSRD